MNTIEQKIAEVLGNPSFYEGNISVEDPEKLIKAVQEKVPEATVDDIGKFMAAVAEELKEENDTLSEEDLEGVAGGVITVTITVAGVVTVVKAAAATGALLGAAAWYWKNRNN